MNGTSISSMNTKGALNYNVASAKGKNEVKSDLTDLMAPPEPIETLEPLQIENTFENPFDFSSVNNPFSMEMPLEIDNPFSTEMPEIDNAFSMEMPEITKNASLVTETNEDGSAMQKGTTGTTESMLATVIPLFGNKSDGSKQQSQKVMSQKELAEKLKCSTCDSRKYQDVSSDPGVSFQSPTKVGRSQAFSAVSSHERQHVSRNQDKAGREDRKVVSQSVTYQSDICTECNKSYISGGTTKTVTKAESSSPSFDREKTFNFEI